MEALNRDLGEKHGGSGFFMCGVLYVIHRGEVDLLSDDVQEIDYEKAIELLET